MREQVYKACLNAHISHEVANIIADLSERVEILEAEINKPIGTPEFPKKEG